MDITLVDSTVSAIESLSVTPTCGENGSLIVHLQLNRGFTNSAYIPLTITGQAQHGVDFTGNAWIYVDWRTWGEATFFGVPDSLYEGNETVTFSIPGGFSATAVIVDQTPAPPAIVTGTLWHDYNNNQQRDAGEGGLAGETVVLTKAGSPPYIATTSANGNFTFTVPAGNYTLWGGLSIFDVPQVAPSMPIVANLSPGQNLALGDLYVVGPGYLAVHVFHDRNGDGLDNDGDEFIPGVAVHLADDEIDGAGVVENLDPSFYESHSEGENWYYLNYLALGQHLVRVEPPSDEDWHFVSPTASDGTIGWSNPNSDMSGVLQVGIYQGGKIQGQAWHDVDRNGLRESSESALAGVTAHLLDASGAAVLDAQNQAVTTTTASDGTYAFAGLRPGDYQVRFDTLPGFEATFSKQGNDPDTDSDADDQGFVSNIVLASGQDIVVDVGLHREVRGVAWHDLNGNGIRETSEPKLVGVNVELTNGSQFWAVQTDANGVYAFQDISAGEYQLYFTYPVPLTAQGQGTDPSLDSDFDPETNTASITLGLGNDPASVDVGINLYGGYVRTVEVAQQSYDSLLDLAVQARDAALTGADSTGNTAAFEAYVAYETTVAEALVTYQNALASIAATYLDDLTQAEMDYQAAKQQLEGDLATATDAYNAAYADSIAAANTYYAALEAADAQYTDTLAPYVAARDAAYAAYAADPSDAEVLQALTDAEAALTLAATDAQAVWGLAQQAAVVDAAAFYQAALDAADTAYADTLAPYQAARDAAYAVHLADPADAQLQQAYEDAEADLATATAQAQTLRLVAREAAVLDAAAYYQALLDAADAVMAATLAPFEAALASAQQAYDDHQDLLQAYNDAVLALDGAALDALIAWDSAEQSALVPYAAASEALEVQLLAFQEANLAYSNGLEGAEVWKYDQIDAAWATYFDDCTSADGEILTAQGQAWGTYTDALVVIHQTLTQDLTAALTGFATEAAGLLGTWNAEEQQAWGIYTTDNANLTPTAPLGTRLQPPSSEVYVWDGGGQNALASNALNWLGDVAPTAGADLVFDSTSVDNVVFDEAFAGLFASIYVNVGYTGTLDFARDVAISQTFSVSDGTITGSHVISLMSGGFAEWLGGAFEGAEEGGTLRIGTDATLIIAGAGTHTIANWTIENRGNVNWISGNVEASMLVVDNRGEWLAHSNGSWWSDLVCSFNNGGVIRVAQASAMLELAELTSTGLIDVSAGILRLVGNAVSNGRLTNSGSVDIADYSNFVIARSGVQTGEFVVGMEAELEVAASVTFSETSSITSAGSVQFTHGISTINGDYVSVLTAIEGAQAIFNTDVDLARVSLSGTGFLSGTGHVSITQNLVWSSGTIDVTQALTIQSTATLNLTKHDALGRLHLDSNLINQGVMHWYDNDVVARGSLMNQGTFRIYGSNNWVSLNTQSQIVNAANAMILKPTWSDTSFSRRNGLTSFATTLRNQQGGTIRIDHGDLQVHGGSNAGAVQVEAGSSLFMVNGRQPNFVWAAGATWSGSGSLRIGDNLHLETDLTVENASLSWGRMTDTGNCTFTVTRSFAWTGGRLSCGFVTIGTDCLMTIGSEPTPGSRKTLDSLLNIAGRVAWTDNSSIHRQIPGVSALWTSYRNPVQVAQNYTTAASNAWETYADSLSDGTSQSPLSRFRAAEAQANQDYETAEAQAANTFETDIACANDLYDFRVSQADLAYATLHPTDPEQAELDYEQALYDAEQEQTQAYEDAFETYRDAKDDAYAEHYTNNYALTDAEATFRDAIATGLTAYRNALLAAASPPTPGSQDVWAMAATFHSRLFPTVDPLALGQPNRDPRNLLEGLTAEKRVALAIAYFRRYGTELATHFDARLTSTLARASRNLLWTGDAGIVPASAPPPERPSLFTRLTRWGTEILDTASTLTVDGVQTQVAQFATNAWETTVNAAYRTSQRLHDDPMGFMSSVGEAYGNAWTVTGNTMTFGLIPSLNSRAEQLLGGPNGGFYRTIQIGAVIGREVAIGMLTSGAGNLAFAGARAAGGAVITGLALSQARQAVLTCTLTTAQRLVQPIMLYRNLDTIAGNIDDAREAIRRGDYENAAALFARSAGGIAGTISSARETFRFARAAATLDPQQVRGYLQACFAAGTPILWEHGSKPIETFAQGERVWARNEFEPDGPLELKAIEECFSTHAEIYHLHAGSQVIRTTAEHPFWVQGKGWTAAKKLEPGDVLVGHDGKQTRVDEVFATGEVKQVYNFRIADYHTYFVGSESWGWTAWAHNLCAGDHHMVPRALGSKVPYRHSILTALDAKQHTHLHRALNDFLRLRKRTLPSGQVVDMYARAGNSGALVRSTFTRAERLAALDMFYRGYRGGMFNTAYLAERSFTLTTPGMFF